MIFHSKTYKSQNHTNNMHNVYGPLGMLVMLLLGTFLVNSEGIEYVYAGLACFLVVLLYFIWVMLKD